MFSAFPERLSSGSLKWQRHAGRGLLPFWVADMDFLVASPIQEALRRRVEHGIFGYTEPTPSLVEVVLHYLKETHGLEARGEWLVWLPGMVPALNLAVRAFCPQPDDTVLTAVPVYPPFLSAPLNAGRPVTRVPLREERGRWTFDWEEMEAAVNPRTRLFLLCHPHNPVGRVWDRAELDRLADWALRHRLFLCSDEIHCDLILDPGKKHLSTLAVRPDLAPGCLALFSPSKTYNLAGLACAYAVIPDPEVRRRFRLSARGLVTEVNAFGYAGCEAAYRSGEPWRQELLVQLRANCDRLEQFIAKEAPEIRFFRPEATYLAWMDARRLALPDPPNFWEGHGLALSHGADFGQPGFLRFNFGCPPAMLEEGLVRFRAALQAWRAGER